MADSAYQFIEICSIFPFLFVFLFAGIMALLIVGPVLLTTGLKTKWATATTHVKVSKIIRIVIGIIFILVALFFIVYSIVGFMETTNRGGIFSNRNNSSSKPQSENALIYYLLMIL